jgi:hypothetical protein
MFQRAALAFFAVRFDDGERPLTGGSRIDGGTGNEKDQAGKRNSLSETM